MALRADDVDLVRDCRLVERFQAGERTAFDDLYRRYFDRLQRYCQRRVGDPLEAEEIAQEAFTRAYRAMPRFAGERRFYPWVTVIASRLCVDTHRRRGRSTPMPEIDTGIVDGELDELFGEVDRVHLNEALTRLGDRHREVLYLREQEGWTYQQIADHYVVTLGTVEALLHRARKALRREFQRLSGENGTALASLPALGWLANRLGAVRDRIVTHAGQWYDVATPLGTKVAGLVGTAGLMGTVLAGGGLDTGSSVATIGRLPARPAVVAAAPATRPASSTPSASTPTTATQTAAAAPTIGAHGATSAATPHHRFEIIESLRNFAPSSNPVQASNTSLRTTLGSSSITMTSSTALSGVTIELRGVNLAVHAIGRKPA